MRLGGRPEGRRPTMMAVVHPLQAGREGGGNERSVAVDLRSVVTAGSGVALHADLDGPGRGPAAVHM